MGGILLESRQRREKAKAQEELRKSMEAAKSVVFVDFRGLSVQDDTALRRKCRESGVSYKVVKNTLALRAAKSLTSGVWKMFLRDLLPWRRVKWIL